MGCGCQGSKWQPQDVAAAVADGAGRIAEPRVPIAADYFWTGPTPNPVEAAVTASVVAEPVAAE